MATKNWCADRIASHVGREIEIIMGYGGGSQCPYWCPGIAGHDWSDEDSYTTASLYIKELELNRIVGGGQRASLNQRAVGFTPTRPTKINQLQILFLSLLN